MDLGFDLGDHIELYIRAIDGYRARCGLFGRDWDVTLDIGLEVLVPGEIVTVRVDSTISRTGEVHIGGDIIARRIDVPRLGLKPLALRREGEWEPDEEEWGEPDEPLPDWAAPIVVRGARPAFEMEQVIPGEDPDDDDTDPILDASDLNAAGDHESARELLMDVLAQDLRCLDAHAHLGNFVFDVHVELALRHYEVGMRIGELSLGQRFDGVLPWGLIDNRPFLRCMHGYGLCLWRLGRKPEAIRVFRDMLWLNPSDNQGARSLLEEVLAGRSWRE